MRIAVHTLMFPAWTETFLRREVMALRDLGHTVAVFTHRVPEGPLVPPVDGVASVAYSLGRVNEFQPDVIYGNLGYAGQESAVYAARQLRVPYALRLWEGLDSFGLPARCKPLYAGLHQDGELCRGLIVEDNFMRGWVRQYLGTQCRIAIVPNSLYVDEYLENANWPDVERKPNVVLSVARLVPKKGLIHLIRAVRQVPEAELWIVGDGRERNELQQAASKQVRFWGTTSEEDLRKFFYPSAGIYCAPCIKMASGDADGVPTAVLEAMAAGLPVVASDLLSMGCYVKQGTTGWLVPPGKENCLAGAIKSLLSDPTYVSMREQLGANAREWARENLDIKKNIRRIEAVLVGAGEGVAA